VDPLICIVWFREAMLGGDQERWVICLCPFLIVPVFSHEMVVLNVLMVVKSGS